MSPFPLLDSIQEKICVDISGFICSAVEGIQLFSTTVLYYSYCNKATVNICIKAIVRMVFFSSLKYSNI